MSFKFGLMAAVCGMVMMIGSSAFAVVLATDTFTYPDGALVPNGGWANQSGTAGTLVVASGEAVVTQDSGSEDTELVVGPEFNSGSMVANFDIRVTVPDPNIGITGSDFEYFAHFSNDTSFNFQARLDVIAPTAGGDYTLGLHSNSSTHEVNLPVDFAFGASVPVELVWDFSTGLATVTAGGSSVTSLTVDLGETLDSFNFRQSSSSSDETIFIDNLVVSHIPEPATLALMLFGLAGIGASRRRS